ncbi:MAG: hypothetical protein EXR79_09125 [Myxococcales bacterium]|nr:hypothetical protein [Myxococcales bacterium]
MTDPSRLFVLEVGARRPVDVALGPGRHELRDCGVEVALDDNGTRVAGLGHGPTAFLLPGARRLYAGAWVIAAAGTRVSWAGREWVLVTTKLAGSEPVPPRAVSLHLHAPGLAARAVLVIEQGKDRGGFLRVHTEPQLLAAGVAVGAVRAKDGAETLRLRVHPAGPAVHVGADPLEPGHDRTVANGDRVVVGAAEAAHHVIAHVLTF